MRSMYRIFALFFLLNLASSACNFTPGVDGEVIQQVALFGDMLNLPCDATTHDPEDSLMVLVWYKNNTPIYSYDARVKSDWFDKDFNKGSRIKFRFGSGHTNLKINQVVATDEGMFHCRVDFLTTPTRNSGVNVTVIVLPSKPFFLDEVGNPVEEKTRAYHEGDNLIISCLAIGGHPTPQLRWYQNGTLLDASDGPSEIPNIRENELFLPLTREIGNISLTCVASNNNMTAPLSCSVFVELYVPPISVMISGLEKPLAEGATRELKCEAVGSHPSPTLSWWLDHQQIWENVTQESNAENNTAVSFWSYTPSRGDVKKVLACVATNELMAPIKGTLQDTAVLDILFSPVAAVINLSGSIDIVEEFATLLLRCEVEANPPVPAVRWYFNDSKILSRGLFDNIDHENHDLIIRNISRHQSGRYSCEASNFQGTSRSRDFDVDVYYPPECEKKSFNSSLRLLGASMECRVNSKPTADVFYWRIENNGKVQKMTTAEKTLHLDLLTGPLDDSLKASCTADNGVGSQVINCEGTVDVVSLKPPQPTNCDIQYLDNEDQFLITCNDVETATYYALSIWSMSVRNSSLSEKWHSEAERAYWRVQMRPSDEAEVKACKLPVGCGPPARIRIPEHVQAYAAKWWQGILDKEVGLSIGIALLVVLFVVSTLVVTQMVRRFGKQKTPVIQVVQLEDVVTREYLQNIVEHKCCGNKSCPSVYSYNSQESAPSVDRTLKPRTFYWDTLPPPDVTSHTLRESTV